MFIDVDSIKIKKSGGTYISLGQYLVEAKYGYNKLWSSDTGRNLAGKNTGTLIGIFPKITCQFRRLTKNELQTLAPILDASKQVLRYYDATKHAYVEMETYTGDWEVTNKHMVNDKHKNEGFSISFIAISKRS